MDKAKFVLTFLAASGIIMGGYFFANNMQESGDALSGQTAKNKLGLNDPLRANESSGGTFFQGSGSAYIPTNAQGNVTRMVAQSMFLKMRQMDQGGANPFGELDTRDPETRAMIEDTMRSVPSTIFATAIDSSELKITSDNSRTAKVRYIEGIRQATNKYFSGQAIDRFTIGSAQELIDSVEQDCFGNGNSKKNAEISKAYEEVYGTYKNMSVPSSYTALHKLILGHFRELSDIYEAFGQCKEDPIRAYVGIDRLPAVYAKAPDIQNMLNEKANELGLR